MLWQRVVTALVGIPVILAVFYIAGWPLAIASILVIGMGIFEFFRMAKEMGIRPLTGWGYAMGFVWILFGVYFWGGQYLSVALWVTFLLSVLYFLWEFPEWNLIDLCITYFGAFYIGGLFSFLIKIREVGFGGWAFVILVFLLTWVNDTAAYFIGSAFGRHRLCPKLSPKKSVEGFLGGVIFTLVTAMIFGYIFSGNLHIMWGLLGILAAIAGAMGDLLESAFKRLSKTKDSGDLIPGHGGILDRLDSLLLVAPLVYYFVWIFLL